MRPYFCTELRYEQLVALNPAGLFVRKLGVKHFGSHSKSPTLLIFQDLGQVLDKIEARIASLRVLVLRILCEEFSDMGVIKL